MVHIELDDSRKSGPNPWTSSPENDRNLAAVDRGQRPGKIGPIPPTDSEISAAWLVTLFPSDRIRRYEIIIEVCQIRLPGEKCVDFPTLPASLTP
jgi:hypothetical protein